MPSWSEVLGDRSIRGQKTLGMPGGFEPLHVILALTRRPMRVLTPVIEIATLAVFHARQDLSLRSAVALELIRDDDPWYVQQALEELAEKLLCRLLIAPPLYKDVKDVVVLIHRAPQIMALAVDGQKYFIQVPFIPGLRATATQPIGVVLPKLPTPLADGFVGHGDTAFEQEFLHVAVAQGEPIVEPDPVADDFAGKAVVFVTRGVGWWGYTWVPILGFIGAWREHLRGDYVTAQIGWSTS